MLRGLEGPPILSCSSSRRSPSDWCRSPHRIRRPRTSGSRNWSRTSPRCSDGSGRSPTTCCCSGPWSCSSPRLALGATALVAGGLAELIDGLTSTGPPSNYPAARIAVGTAIVATTAPHLGRPVRRLGRWVVLLGSPAVVALGIALPLGVISGLAIAAGSAALTHLAFGSPGGLPSLDQVRAALEELGVEAVNLRAAELQRNGSPCWSPRATTAFPSWSRSTDAMPGTASC
jgi:hypothetical protein